MKVAAGQAVVDDCMFCGVTRYECDLSAKPLQLYLYVILHACTLHACVVLHAACAMHAPAHSGVCSVAQGQSQRGR